MQFCKVLLPGMSGHHEVTTYRALSSSQSKQLYTLSFGKILISFYRKLWQEVISRNVTRNSLEFSP
jgi:hypothetical protein